MDIAIVTGANTRVGLAISRKLIETGCRVYGLAENINGIPFEHTDFIPVSCDLSRTEHLCQVVQEITEKEKDIYILVNQARTLGNKPFEEMELNDLESLVHANLLAPLILTRLVLPSITRLSGFILNIGLPDFPGNQCLGSPYLSAEVALKEFSKRLYEEVRQDNVKVCSLILDVTDVESMVNAGFTERDNPDLILGAEAIAQAVEFIISQKKESVVSTLVVRPQKSEADAKDLAKARKLSPPQPFIQRELVKNVAIGRLQKEEKPVSTLPTPATYMGMAREVADEELQAHEPIRGNQPQAPSHKPRRRRRRGNRQRMSSDQPRTEEAPKEPKASPEQAPKEPNVSAEQPPKKQSRRRRRPSKQEQSTKSTVEPKVSQENSSPKQAPKQQRPEKPEQSKKPAEAPEAGPETNSPPKRRPRKKVAAKKTASKRVAKQPAKKQTSSD
jgi:NADP-dependent 3-hydroxy acid dehydrogenase YdfG